MSIQMEHLDRGLAAVCTSEDIYQLAAAGTGSERCYRQRSDCCRFSDIP